MSNQGISTIAPTDYGDKGLFVTYLLSLVLFIVGENLTFTVKAQGVYFARFAEKEDNELKERFMSQVVQVIIVIFPRMKLKFTTG